MYIFFNIPEAEKSSNLSNRQTKDNNFSFAGLLMPEEGIKD